MKNAFLFLTLLALTSLAWAQTPGTQANQATAQWQKIQRQFDLARKPTTVQQLDSVHVSVWEVDDWTLSTRIQHTNNASQQVISALTLLQDSLGSATWHKNDSTGYAYTAFDSIATEETYLWDPANATWMPGYQDHYVYNASQKRDSLISYTWHDTSWVLSATDINTWTAFDSLAANVALNFDETGAITGGARITNRYNAANKLDSTLTEAWDLTADDWVLNMLDVYHYNSQGLADTAYSYQPDSAQTGWVLAGATAITYDANGRPTVVVSQVDLGDGLEDFIRINITYMPDGQMASMKVQFKNFFGSGWLTLNETTYTYDAEGHLVDEVTAGADILSGGTTLENQSRTQYYWNDLNTGTAANVANQLRILVANPAKAGSAIHFAGINGAATLTISDLQGKVLASRQIGDAETTLPMTLRTGLYLIQVQAGTAPAVTEKILILE